MLFYTVDKETEECNGVEECTGLKSVCVYKFTSVDEKPTCVLNRLFDSDCIDLEDRIMDELDEEFREETLFRYD